MEVRILKIETPKHVFLDGLWLGNPKAQNVIVFVHGLGSSMFSNTDLLYSLVGEDTSVIALNTRGHGIISRIIMQDKRRKKGRRSFLGGQTHEVFKDCIDDLQGVVDYANGNGVKNIILLGHSTGAQKCAYFLSKTKNINVKALVLLSPLSDYAGFVKRTPKETRDELLKLAKHLINSGNSHTILPQTIWPQLHDAQRFLSLFSGNSDEEVFPYWDKKIKPAAFQKIKLPMLVILGDKDEYRDRPIKQIQYWFVKNNKSDNFMGSTIPNAGHGFDENTKGVTEIINNWIKELVLS